MAARSTLMNERARRHDRDYAGVRHRQCHIQMKSANDPISRIS
jgi:hypothetical protein